MKGDDIDDLYNSTETFYTKSSADLSLDSISIPLYKKFGDKPAAKTDKTAEDSPVVTEETSLSRFVVLFSLFLIVLLFTLAGGFMFMGIETSYKKNYESTNDCFIKGKSKGLAKGWNVTRTLDFVERCLTEKSRIDTPARGFLYSWVLYTTCGYGNTYPMTDAGQIISTAFIVITVPLFMAFKIELGHLVTICVLKIGRIIQRAAKMCRIRFEGDINHPSDGLLACTLIFILIIYLAFTTVFIAYIENLSFLESFYLTYISIFLVGLGDVAPSTEWTTFVCILPLFIFGDTIQSYISYYMHGCCRIYIHRFSIWLTCNPISVAEQKPSEDSMLHRVSVKNKTDFPSITTTSMPLNIMSCTTAEAAEDKILVGHASSHKRPSSPHSTQWRALDWKEDYT